MPYSLTYTTDQPHTIHHSPQHSLTTPFPPPSLQVDADDVEEARRSGYPHISTVHGQVRMWLVAEEDIEKGCEIRYDILSANLPRQVLGQMRVSEDYEAKKATSKKESAKDEDDSDEDDEENEGGGRASKVKREVIIPWRKRKQPPTMRPPALGPDPLHRLDERCFGKKFKEEGDEEEGEDGDDTKSEASHDRCDCVAFRLAVEPPPVYL